jgi:hypothetical protein
VWVVFQARQDVTRQSNSEEVGVIGENFLPFAQVKNLDLVCSYKKFSTIMTLIKRIKRQLITKSIHFVTPDKITRLI